MIVEPFAGSAGYATRYRARVDDYAKLGAWCRERQGLAIVCKAAGATWLPFERFCDAKSLARRVCSEVVWTARSEAA